jgi:cation transport regulator ChaB
MQNKAAAAISSAQQVVQAANTHADTQLREEQARNVAVDTRLKEAEFHNGDPYGKTYKSLESFTRRNQLMKQTETEIERIQLTRSQRELVQQEIKNAIKQGRRIEADTRDTTANAVLKELARFDARNEANFARENPNYPYLERGVELGGKFLGSAAQAARAGQGFKARPGTTINRYYRTR